MHQVGTSDNSAKTENTRDGNEAQVKPQVATVRQIRGDGKHDSSALCFRGHEEAKSRSKSDPNKQGGLPKPTRG